MSQEQKHEIEVIEIAFDGDFFDEQFADLKVEQQQHTVSALQAVRSWHD